jgi:hypothetical protein
MTECPKCGDSFESDHGMKIHHFREHGESLAVKESICSIEGCKNSFEYYPSEKEGLICPSCIKSGKNIHHTDEYSDLGERVTNYIKTSCFTCGENMVVSQSDYSDRVFCDEECLSDFQSDRMTGSSNPRYVDGSSSGKKYNSLWRSVRDKSLDRDNHQCVICGSDEYLHVHHIIPVREFDDEDNAHYIENTVTVCPSCHRKIEYGKESLPDDVIDENNLEKFSGDHLQKT